LQLDWTFFGLTSTYKLATEGHIHDLAFHSKGAFSYTEIRNMPVFIRTFHIDRLNKFFKKQKEEHDKAMRKSRIKSPKRR
jgi:hypothetical protein